MENTSPFLAMRQLEMQLKTLLRSVDAELLEPGEKKAVASLRRLVVDARLDIRDYELSETRDAQLKCAVASKKRLAQLEKVMLAASTVFGPADIAQLSAQIQQIEGKVI